MSDLASPLNVAEREVRRKIECQRVTGNVICSHMYGDGTGYCLPENEKTLVNLFGFLNKELIHQKYTFNPQGQSYGEWRKQSRTIDNIRYRGTRAAGREPDNA